MAKKRDALPARRDLATVRAALPKLLNYEKSSSGLNVRQLAVTPRKGYKVEKLEFLSEPGIYIPTWVFIPDNYRAGSRATLYVHENGKQADGLEFGPLERMAREGQLSVAIDVRGIGETRPPHPQSSDRPGEYGFLFDVETAAAYMAWYLDQSLVGMRVKDVVRAVDYTLSRPDVDRSAVSLIAKGNGAVWSLFAAALDPRIAALRCERGLLAYRELLNSDRYNYNAGIFLRDRCCTSICRKSPRCSPAANLLSSTLSIISAAAFPRKKWSQLMPKRAMLLRNQARCVWHIAEIYFVQQRSGQEEFPWAIFIQRSYMRIFVLALCAAISISPSFGQTTTASITGTVTDPSGAIVPGAKVTVISEGTGSVREVLTGAAALSFFRNLTIGSYKLAVAVAGFSPYERTGMMLNANQVLNADIKLSLLQAGTAVQVTDQGAAISTETTNISNIKTSRDLQELPLISRHGGDQGFYSYVLQNPGVNSMPGNSLNNVQGVRQQAGVLPTMDGIAVMAYPIGPGPRAAESGRRSGGQRAVGQHPGRIRHRCQLRSRHQSLAPTSSTAAGSMPTTATSSTPGTSSPPPLLSAFITTSRAASAAPSRRTRPSSLATMKPRAKRRRSLSPATRALPEWRTGDFSGQPVRVIDPTTGAQFPGNRIPASRINPVSQKVQDFFYPLPNFGAAGLQSGNWRGQFPGNTGFTRFDDFGVRVDHNFRNGDRVYTRVNYRRLPLTAREASLPPVGQRDQLRGSRSAVISWTHMFSPSVLNEARTGFTRQRNFYKPSLVGSDIIDAVGIQGVTTKGINNVPAFNITGLTSTDQPNSQALTLDTNFQWTDNLSWTRGRHSMKFGFDAIRDQLGGYNYPNSMYGSYNFTGTYTGAAYGDFLLGIPQTTQLAIPNPPRYLRGTMWEGTTPRISSRSTSA